MRLNHWRVHSYRLAACRVRQNPSRRVKFRNTSQLAAVIGISRILLLLKLFTKRISVTRQKSRLIIKSALLLRLVLEEIGNNVWLLISHKMPATYHYLCGHVTAAKLSGKLFGCWPRLTRAIIAFEEEYRHM